MSENTGKVKRASVVSEIKRGGTLTDLFGDPPQKIEQIAHPPMVPTVPYTDSNGKVADVPLSVFCRALESKIAARRRAFRGRPLTEYREAMTEIMTAALAMISEQCNMLPDWASWDSENDATQEGEHGAASTVAKSHPDHPDPARRS